MTRIFGALLCFAVVGLSGSAYAIPFVGTYTVNANSGPGLIINTTDLAPNPFTFDVAEGDSFFSNLFQIWTPETDVGGDDVIPRPISVTFAFSEPSPSFGGSVEGDTVGFTLFGFIEGGTVQWGGPIVLNYGALGDGELEISLQDALFNPGFFGLTPGAGHGATVGGSFKKNKEASAVFEPSSIGLLAGGLIVLAVVMRRRRGAKP